MPSTRSWRVTPGILTLIVIEESCRFFTVIEKSLLSIINPGSTEKSAKPKPSEKRWDKPQDYRGL